MKKFYQGIMTTCFIILMVIMCKLPVSAADKVYNNKSDEFLFEIEERIKEAMLKGESSVRISDLQIPVEDGLFGPYDVFSVSPYLGQLEECLAWSSGVTKCYVKLSFTNPMNIKETKAYFSEVDAALDELYSMLENVEKEEEKALVLHDYIVLNCEYDYDRYLSKTLPPQSYRSAGVLLDGLAVCQGYASLYDYILSNLGIECYIVHSEEMIHAWNIVRMGAYYYHVDITWDDPVPDRLGIVQHTYFMRSDAEFLELEHSGWEAFGLVCEDDSLGNSYWSNSESAVYVEGIYAYYIEGLEIKRHHIGTGETEVLLTLPYWRLYGTNYYYPENAFSGLVLWEGALYYNTDTQIHKIMLEEGEDQILFELPSDAEGYIYGMRKNGTQMEYVLKSSARDEGEQVVCEAISFEKQEVQEWLHGDVNGDDVINLKDYMHMKRYLQNVITEESMFGSADLTEDCLIDEQDLYALFALFLV